MRNGQDWMVSIALLALWSSAQAHHSQAPFFDQSRDVRIEGVVQKFDFRNPHAILYVEVEGDRGVEVWQLQFASVTILIRAGVTADSFEPGERIVAIGHPSRNAESLGMASIAATKQDGTQIIDPLRSGAFSPQAR